LGEGGILGINAFHGDASAAVVGVTDLLACVEEERFTRVKHWAGFPGDSIRQCVAEVGGGGLEGIESVAVSRKPNVHLLQKGLLALRHPRSLFRAAGRVKNLAAISSIERRLKEAFPGVEIPKIHAVEHHVAHVASAFLCSPYEEAACLTVDGFGDFVSTMLAVGRGSEIEVLDRVLFPH